MRRALSAFTVTALLALTSCSGFREVEGKYTVHAESIRLFGLAIPGDDLERALEIQNEEFPGSIVITQHSTPSDWTSVLGVLNNILGVTQTTITGSTN